MRNEISIDCRICKTSFLSVFNILWQYSAKFGADFIHLNDCLFYEKDICVDSVMVGFFGMLVRGRNKIGNKVWTQRHSNIDFNIRLTTYNPLPLELRSYPILYSVFSLHLPYLVRSLRSSVNFDILYIASLRIKIM